MKDNLNFLNPLLQDAEINKMSMLALAHIGDAVYELMTRTYLCASDHTGVSDLHRAAVSLVNAPFQARGAEKIVGILTEDEYTVYKRGRNAKVNSVPAHATVGEYHAATGVEALFGWLYLQGKMDRLNGLFQRIMGITEEKDGH